MNKVTVLCPTYNHEKYIERALQGFVMQKTNFPFECIIADDASTDGTAEIIKIYTQQYPDLIKPVFREKNLGSALNFQAMIQNITTDYVAICEGDDFWTDENKLQIQFDFLEKHQDYAFCFHPVTVIYEDENTPSEINPSPDRRSIFYHPKINPYANPDLTQADIIEGLSIPCCSVMYRWRFKNGHDLDLFPTDVSPRDVLNNLLHAETGKIYFINKNMGCYYRPKESYWTKKAQLMAHFEEQMNFFQFLKKRYEKKYIKIFQAQEENLYKEAFSFFQDQKDIEKLSELLKYDDKQFFKNVEINAIQKLRKDIKKLKIIFILFSILFFVCHLIDLIKDIL